MMNIGLSFFSKVVDLAYGTLRNETKRNETVLCEMVLCETVLCETVLCETVTQAPMRLNFSRWRPNREN